MKSKLNSSLCILVFILFYSTSNFNFAQTLSLEELCKLSDNIVLTKTISFNSYLDSKKNRIYSDINLEVKETISGSLRINETVTIKMLGGEHNGLQTFVIGGPTFSRNEESILFLKKIIPKEFGKIYYVIVGMAQGKFNINFAEGEKIVSRVNCSRNIRVDKNSIPLKFSSEEPMKLQTLITYVKSFL